MSAREEGTIDQPPGLLLELEATNLEDLPPPLRFVRPVDVASVLTTIEAIYIVTVLNAPPPRLDEKAELEWVRQQVARSRRLGMRAVRMESPLQVLLELPWPVYAAGFSGFMYGIAHVLGVPYRAATRFYDARDEYWTSRLREARSKEEWLDWKADRAEREIPFRLTSVQEASNLPSDDSDGDATLA